MSAVAVTATSLGLIRCDHCGLLVRRPEALLGRAGCPRCHGTLHRRKHRSVERTWALLITAVILYVPANLLPIMTVTSAGWVQPDTILSGVWRLFQHGMWPIALLVFVASILVPLLKLLSLSFLLISVHRRSRWRPEQRTILYRITELIGRWSMVDIYVVTILVALVKLGARAEVDAEPGAIFFGAVVVATMMAAESFDPRLIWDRNG